MLAKYINFDIFLKELKSNLDKNLISNTSYIGMTITSTPITSQKDINDCCEILYDNIYKSKLENDVAGIEYINNIYKAFDQFVLTKFYIYQNGNWNPIEDSYIPKPVYDQIYDINIDIIENKLYVSDSKNNFNTITYSSLIDFVNSWDTSYMREIS